MSEARVEPAARLAPEDEARADFYALLGRLFADPPGAELLAAIASAPALEPVASATEGDDVARALKSAWDDLRAASAAADPDAIRDEFLTLFVGVGRSEVSLYASHYLGPQSGRPLADVRAALSELGLARRPESNQYEDHLSVLLETMRMLVGGDGETPPADVAKQRWFFDRHLAPWAQDCCTAIDHSAVANYYRRVAQFCSCFVALERDSLAMD
jgi:TorA maturation chaperone TorD